MSNILKLNSFLLFTCSLLLTIIIKDCGSDKPDWAKKDIRDFDDADMERLFDQWEDNDDEPLPEDELPEYKRPPPPVPDFNFDKMGSMSPDEILKLTKKGKTLMMFVNLIGTPDQQETETITSLWQTSLRNNHIQAERYVIENGRAIFLFHDGAQAWDAKKFLLEQENVDEVTLEGQVSQGKFSTKKNDDKSGKNKKTEL